MPDDKEKPTHDINLSHKVDKPLIRTLKKEPATPVFFSYLTDAYHKHRL